MSKARLLLLSLGLGRIASFMNGVCEGKLLAFIPTAGTPYKNPEFIIRDRDALRTMGFNVRDVLLEKENTETLRVKLADADVVFVAGGNSFYLLREVRVSGFDTVMEELLHSGVPYIGASAGATITGPDLSPLVALDDPGAAPDLAKMKGLGLVDFVTLPHYGVETYITKYQAILERFRDKLHMIPLCNDQAIEVIGDNYEVVDSPQ